MKFRLVILDNSLAADLQLKKNRVSPYVACLHLSFARANEENAHVSSKREQLC